MAQTVSVIVSPEDRTRLAAVIGDRNRPLKHVQRVRIVLLSADRLPVLEIARQAGVSRPSVWLHKGMITTALSHQEDAALRAQQPAGSPPGRRRNATQRLQRAKVLYHNT